MYLENDKYQLKNIEIIVLFVTPGMQQRGTSRHVFIYIVSFFSYYFFSVDFVSFYIFPLHVHQHLHKYFKLYNNDRNYLVLKYVFNDVGMRPLVLEQKIHQKLLCTVSNIIRIWHPLTVLFMIFSFQR